MIPRVAKSGRSFKGAGLYYLHDKGALTADRVAFTETLNLPTNDADRGIAHMIDTATHADQLKQEAGIKGGRPLQAPVYCYSLAWHPSETPTKAEQLEAVQATLKRLGVSDRQAVIIGHNDTDHTHVHVMVNRVCPTTGKASTMSNDRLILSDWAHEYREKRGELHFCPQREENRKNRKNQFVKDQSPTRQEWQAWKASQTKDIWDAFRADRAKARSSRKGQYDALWQQKENRTAQRREEIKALYKPKWRDLFKKQRYELKNFDAGFFDRLGFALTRGGRSKIIGFLQAVTNDGMLRADFIRDQEREKKQLGQEHKHRIADSSREVRKAWQYDHDQLKASHEAQDQRAYDTTKAKSTEVWETPAPEQTKPDFEKSADRRDKAHKPKRRSFEAFFGGDEKAIQTARDNQKKQRETNRKRNRSRKRDRDDGGREFEP
jgi:hypothetical protein